LTFVSLIASILSIGFAIGVIIAVSSIVLIFDFDFSSNLQVGFLLIIQLKNILCNQTTIENLILCKARDRDHQRIEPFIYPYDLGFRENLRQIFNRVDDGLTWSVRADCDQYTFTREQLEQQSQRAVRYKIIQSYNGSFYYDLRTCIDIPCSSERRMPVKKGDYVFVTRWKNYWLYGRSRKSNEHIRGWFPRCCVNEIFDMKSS
jgi:palmitoyltransferase